MCSEYAVNFLASEPSLPGNSPLKRFTVSADTPGYDPTSSRNKNDNYDDIHFTGSSYTSKTVKNTRRRTSSSGSIVLQENKIPCLQSSITNVSNTAFGDFSVENEAHFSKPVEFYNLNFESTRIATEKRLPFSVITQSCQGNSSVRPSSKISISFNTVDADRLSLNGSEYCVKACSIFILNRVCTVQLVSEG